ncbi:MAG: DUF58 domain-containing protein [Phycisphaerae bacterium]|nr:DUF58 domain-containing protein [Phycisphaerae bacterium]
MRRRYHLHLPGILYVALTILVGVAAANRPNNLLVWVFGAMLAGVMISGVVSGGMLMGIRASRLDPRRGAVGEPLVLRYAVSNRSRIWPAFNLHIEERPVAARKRPADAQIRAMEWQRSMRPADGWVLHVGPGETVHSEVVFVPNQRGRVSFEPLRVWTTFPFGFLRKSVTFEQRTETLVFPRLLSLRDDLISSLVRGGMGGFRLSSSPGPGEDYFGVREYRPGDSVRQIAWKRVAMGQGLVSIERSRTSPPRLRVVLNLRTPTDQLRLSETKLTAREVEENAISLGASLIARAESEGYEVGLTVLGLPTPRVPLRRGHWHVEKLMAALAGLDLDAPRDDHGAVVEADRDRATIVVVHPDRAVPSVAPPGAWHLVGSKLESFVAVPDANPQQSRTEARS